MERVKPALLLTLLTLFPFYGFAATFEEAQKAYNQKKFENAYTILESLSQDNPNDTAIFLLLGHTAVKLAKWEMAVNLLERVVSLDSQSIAAYIQLGFLYEKRKEPEKAKTAWEKVIELAKDPKTKNFAQKHRDNLK